jgi:cell division septum initiation protein DivIVA
MTEEMRARFMTLEQLNATLNERVVQLEAEKATLQTRLTSLESATSSFSQLVGRIVALEASAHSKALPPSTTSASIATASTAILSKKILQSANVEVTWLGIPD